MKVHEKLHQIALVPIALILLLILVSSTALAAETSNDFIRTSQFIQGYADYINVGTHGHNPSYTNVVDITVTSNNPNGVVTYAKGTMKAVVPWLGSSSQYFIQSSRGSLENYDQYYNNRKWEPNDFWSQPSNYIRYPIYPFSPKLTNKIHLLIFNTKPSYSGDIKNRIIAASVGHDFIPLTENNGVLEGFGRDDPSTKYIITLQKNTIETPG